VGYVNRNAIAGREFSSWAELEAHLVRWSREVPHLRVHGTTGEVPLERFVRAEAQALQPLPDKPSYLAERELVGTGPFLGHQAGQLTAEGVIPRARVCAG
jgi:hypothetical protein